jgi:nucleoid-associated protein YgaU
MTTDAKIGLLLSLIFIFIIAFIINGLPNFIRGDDSNRLMQDYLTKLRNYEPDITQGAREVVEVVNNQDGVEGSRGGVNNEIRYKQPLPGVVPVMSDSEVMRTTALSVNERSREIQPISSSKPAGPEVYVVQDDDNLYRIAEKFYGSQEGSKKENIKRIFQANRSVLSSPDLIPVGQSLVIPPLAYFNEGTRQANAEFEKRLFGETQESGKISLPLASIVQAKTGRYLEYVVKEGDSLWQIAKEQLGNADRYVEIARLNNDIIEDEEFGAVGMRIKLPGI